MTEKNNMDEVVNSFAEENRQEGLRVFVAGGNRPGTDPIYVEEAYNLGRQIIKLDFKLDFGLSNSGIMGAVARGVLDGWNKKQCAGAPIQGITTKEYYSLYQTDEILSQIEDVIVAQTLEERKQKLLNADFVVSLDHIMEVRRARRGDGHVLGQLRLVEHRQSSLRIHLRAELARRRGLDPHSERQLRLHHVQRQLASRSQLHVLAAFRVQTHVHTAEVAVRRHRQHHLAAQTGSRQVYIVLALLGASQLRSGHHAASLDITRNETHVPRTRRSSTSSSRGDRS